jgi:hypothetical protein
MQGRCPADVAPAATVSVAHLPAALAEDRCGPLAFSSPEPEHIENHRTGERIEDSCRRSAEGEGGGGLLVVPLIFGLARLRFDADVLNLLPGDLPSCWAPNFTNSTSPTRAN